MNDFSLSIFTRMPATLYIGAAFLTLTLALVGIFLIANRTTEHSFWSRIIAWRNPHFNDFANKFLARPIPNGPVAYHFRPAPNLIPTYLSAISHKQDGSGMTTPFEPFLVSTGTKAFLALKGDQLLYEGYFNNADRSSTQTSFSIAKSFVSALVGIAIEEGFLTNIDDAITLYLHELATRPGLDQVRIRDLLTMSSGLHFNGTGAGGNPFGDDARAYYDPDLRSLALGVQAEVPPGIRWQYNNFHPLLLGMILERTTHRTVSTYLTEKLWQPLGMEAPGSWSLDSHHDGFEKMESGLNGRAIDFAKFGLLYLRLGLWEGHQLIPRSWVTASTHHDPGTDPTRRGMGDLDYGYMWWLDAQIPGRYLAWGNLGQFIYLAPDRDVVLVRFGTRYGIRNQTPWFDWVSIFRNLASCIP